ncbi:hypothetical protein Barb6XT_03023 [Bacteroidales bacterium Barb6XT]|nr:hypothetical protein Barb6XT_03023 [Bacteroidales bacterium Barb6XT]
MDIEDSLYSNTIDKATFFRSLQVWPLDEVLNYKGWLNNFSDPEERKIACLILDFFMFYPKNMLNQMLKSVVGYAGYIFASHFSDWEHDDFKNRCIYSFIPGETINPTDSGHIYVRKLRNSLGIPEERIVAYSELYSILENSTTNFPVIFVDDFVGSGAQCDKAWNDNRGGLRRYTLSEIATTSGHKFVYAPLIVNKMGYDRICNECTGLTLVPSHILNDEYNLFNQKCICWKGDIDLYDKGTQLIIEKSRDLGIPSTNGDEVIDVKGFGEQGLALAFDDDGVPDAIPAIFYWCADNWTPLIKKEYQR